VPEQTRKKPELLALKESHLETVGDVTLLSIRCESLRRDIGVLGWRMKTLEESLTKSEPFSTSISDKKRIKSLNRLLTTGDSLTQKIANSVNRLEASLLRRALTAGSLSESE